LRLQPEGEWNEGGDFGPVLAGVFNGAGGLKPVKRATEQFLVRHRRG
jgi:hypothetical protein